MNVDEMKNTAAPRLIASDALLEQLEAAGVVPPNTRRAVIDASVEGPVVVYVEAYGDERALSVATALAGVEVEVKRASAREVRP